MRFPNDIIQQYYEDVPLGDDYNLIEPELIKLDDVDDVNKDAKIQSEMGVRKKEKTESGDVLIVGAGITGKQNLKEALALLPQDKIAGLVLNRFQGPNKQYGRYGYGYGYGKK